MSVVSVVALTIVGLSLPIPALATPATIIPQPSTSFTADRLPTVQINGVVWSTDLAGDKVFAGGSFTRARPAGAAAGTNETVRNNFLAFDIRTGDLIPSFVPNLNGQVLDVAVSPDKSRVYVVGDFTTANGQARRRVAAFSTTTGALISSFNPVGVNSRARAITVTNTTVYVGGGFLGAGGSGRSNLAAFRVSDGALLPWAPSTNLSVWALAAGPNGQDVFASGQFTKIDNKDAYGLAKLDAATGMLDSAWHPEVRNGGADAAVGSIRLQGDFMYGTTWHFGPGGNLEGAFKVPLSSGNKTGNVDWVTDCHGDNYDSMEIEGTVYTAGHSHYCGNMGGGFPQYPKWRFQHSLAFSDTVTGDILNDVHGYPNWHGKKPGPALVHWLPEMSIGNYTGQYQAGWTITGNSNYLVYGGEFPRVNGTAQQGLVRFGKRPNAPGTQGPTFVGGSFVPQASAQGTNSVRITWPAAYDRDDRSLTYRLYRGWTVIDTQIIESNWWTLPALGHVDTGVSAGTTNNYRLTVSDTSGNTVWSSTISHTQPGTVAPANAYANSVTGAGATLYWPMNDTRTGSPMAIRDRAGFNDGVADNDVTAGQPGAIQGDAAMSFGTSQPNQPWGRLYASGTEYAPDTFTLQAWVKTNTTRGGRIVGFGDLQFGNSGHRDRHLYMANNGQILFGVRAQDGSNRTVSTGQAYNDNNWHLITASMGARGMELYVDGVRVARRADTMQGETYLGYWRVQGDNLSGWPSRPATDNFVGAIDEVSVYPTALSQTTILQQYAASGRTTSVPQAPADAYGASVFEDEPDLYWRFDEASGTTATDSGPSLNTGTYRSGVTLGGPGVIAGNRAAKFDGSNDVVYSNNSFANPTIFSTEAWFKTTTTSGGKIIGFGNAQNGQSSSYDRHVYMLDNGTLVFGVWTGQMNTITTPVAFNDGDWHHVVATQSAAGMKLYVDGLELGANPQSAAQAYDGYWRVGGDSRWAGTSDYFNGTIDEAAVYAHELPTSRVIAHYEASGRVVVQPPNVNPVASFTTQVNNLTVVANGGASIDPDGTIAAYAWDFGDGTSGTGINPSHTYADEGDFGIVLTVTDNRGGTHSVTHVVTVVKPVNQEPTAAFTSSVNQLTVTFNAGGSTDPDGTITGYSWNFGDGETGTGINPSHSYAIAGIYTITLTVTDDRGGTGSVSTTVDTTLPVNQEPIAAFTSSANQLTVTFNAAGSTDPDGTITGYSWDFGDGATGTGSATSHTFAAPGTYTVGLTVTDNDAATNTTSSAVTVTALSHIALDDFERTVVNGWGNADTGGTWTRTGAATNFSVSEGVARLKMVSGSGPGSYLNEVSARDVELQGNVSYDKPGTGGGIFSSFIVRRDGTSDYRAVVRTTASAVTLQIQRTMNGAATVLGTTVTLPGGTLAAGETVVIKIRAVGQGTTTVQAKAWRLGVQEPAGWTVTTTDTTAALQDAGGVGLYSYMSGSATNGPVNAAFSSFDVSPA